MGFWQTIVPIFIPSSNQEPLPSLQIDCVSRCSPQLPARPGPDLEQTALFPVPPPSPHSSQDLSREPHKRKMFVRQYIVRLQVQQQQLVHGETGIKLFETTHHPVKHRPCCLAFSEGVFQRVLLITILTCRIGHCREDAMKSVTCWQQPM